MAVNITGKLAVGCDIHFFLRHTIVKGLTMVHQDILKVLYFKPKQQGLPMQRAKLMSKHFPDSLKHVVNINVDNKAFA